MAANFFKMAVFGCFINVNSILPQLLPFVTTGTTFQAYAREEILPRIEKYAHKYKQTHVVFDTYQEGSLKSQTRQKRGTEARDRISAKSC